MYIDTHIHLTDNAFSADREKVIDNFLKAGVGRAINVGYDLNSSIESKKIAESHKEIYFAAGLHPDDEKSADEITLAEIKELTKCEKCVAVGEIGLDYHYEGFDKEGQKRAFISQLALASEAKLPVIIHSRDAAGDMTDILKANKELLGCGGVMHCFSGSIESMKIYLDLGFYISFSGVVTFKNAVNVQEAVKYVPEDFYLAETDCPYMAPVPHRGERNEPQFVPLVYEKLAFLRGRSLESVQERIESNARKLFKRLK